MHAQGEWYAPQKNWVYISDFRIPSPTSTTFPLLFRSPRINSSSYSEIESDIQTLDVPPESAAVAIVKLIIVSFSG